MPRIYSQGDPESRPLVFRNLLQEAAFVFAIMMANNSTPFLLGVIIINTAAISRDLQMGPSQMTWISASIGITGGCLMLFFAKTADILGPRTQLISGLSIISFSALFLSISPNPIFLITFCAIMGLGIGAVGPPAVRTVLKTYPAGSWRKKIVMGCLAAGNPLSIVVGCLLSGVGAAFFSWRAGLVAMSIFYFFIALLAMWTTPRLPRSSDRGKILRQFDYIGTVLIAVGIALISAGLTTGPTATNGWKTPIVIVLLILGVGCTFMFAAWQYIHPYPLVNPTIWRDRNFTLCVLCAFFGYMSFAANEFWITFFMQNMQDLSALKIAVYLTPFAAAGLVWTYLGQYFLRKIDGRIVMGIGAIGYLVGSILLMFNRENTSYWKIVFPALIFMIFGVVFQFLVSNFYIAKHMSTQTSLAGSVVQIALRLSVSMALTITTAVYGTISHAQVGQESQKFPYTHTYLCSTIFAVLGLVGVPFIKIKTQERESLNQIEAVEIQYDGYPETSITEECIWCKQNRKGKKSSNGSRSSEYSMATTYFPRFSWEDERDMLLEREKRREPGVAYEVCINCLRERRIEARGEQAV
ncbi:major facilitator superfamily domain-containing protein [Xylogone sp. PMI_703]|nr:major facilitator superfamily domain-containing protein [Xylogone sp. PMI_703]